MTGNAGFDRRIFDFLDREAGHGSPDYLDDILSRTARTRQRPAWTSIERWLPVDLSTHRSVFSRPAQMRSIAVLVVLALLIAAFVALAVGSRRSTLLPYGLARNGAIVSSHDGDIYSVDPGTGAKTPLITDSKFDFAPLFSRDGTKFSFLRGPDPCGKPDCGLILSVANADGSGVRELTRGIVGLDTLEWSPDSSRIVFLSRVDGDGLINLINTDGTGMTTLNIGRPAHMVTWLPPDGREILFRGEQLHDTDPPPGIFAVRPDGTGLREISTRPAVDRDDYEDLTVSPDGTRVAYRSTDERVFRIHIMDLRTGRDIVVLPTPPETGQLGAAHFSPDSLKVAYTRIYGDNTFQLVIAPADGSGPGITLGPRRPLGTDGPGLNFDFTPDGTAVIADYDLDRVAMKLPVDGSQGSILSEGASAFAGYQRLAP